MTASITNNRTYTPSRPDDLRHVTAQITYLPDTARVIELITNRYPNEPELLNILGLSA